jgi:phosphoribosylglycinamide formyltransferase-1
MTKIGFLVSHNGTLMQTVVKACRDGRLAAEPRLVISNNLESGALNFARKENLAWRHLSSSTHGNPSELDQAILDTLREAEAELILLLGYNRLLGPKTLQAYKGHIFNIHPSLLPKFGGKGMYGIRVHEAVIAAKEKATGITIHHVSPEYDQGEIVSQCTITVQADDTAQSLAARVLQREYTFLVETLQKLLSKKM